jgi:outer membrane protein assembly factor BamD
MNKFLYILLFSVLFVACSPYQKALKSEDLAYKYEIATQKYEKGKYEKAIRLFEQIAGPNRGKPQAEKLFYMFAQSYYKTGQYVLAGYQFESFAATYPKSEHREEAYFLSAKSYSMLSPVYSLDQVDTEKAIDKLQTFINTYPNSTHFEEANKIIVELRDKLEKKAFEVAKAYGMVQNPINDYKAGIKSLDNFISDYPGSKYKEEALYYKFDFSYNYALKSIASKVEERLNSAKLAYAGLMRYKPDTKYKKDADEKLAQIEIELQKFSK